MKRNFIFLRILLFVFIFTGELNRVNRFCLCIGISLVCLDLLFFDICFCVFRYFECLHPSPISDSRFTSCLWICFSFIFSSFFRFMSHYIEITKHCKRFLKLRSANSHSLVEANHLLFLLFCNFKYFFFYLPANNMHSNNYFIFFVVNFFFAFHRLSGTHINCYKYSIVLQWMLHLIEDVKQYDACKLWGKREKF